MYGRKSCCQAAHKLTHTHAHLHTLSRTHVHAHKHTYTHTRTHTHPYIPIHTHHTHTIHTPHVHTTYIHNIHTRNIHATYIHTHTHTMHALRHVKHSSTPGLNVMIIAENSASCHLGTYHKYAIIAQHKISSDVVELHSAPRCVPFPVLPI